ncbi:MAG TPA: exodeoxyribonuclease VII small subunit [Candidatus Dormibacteraeota bacterium]|nr:exodeoxyribonuclease VII small subunit [Candidatus Dormibacteraeota bacterium]
MSQAAPERPTEPARFEEVLTTLEKTIAELAGGTAPLEELVAAHQRALVLLAEAQSRLEELKARADQIARQLT